MVGLLVALAIGLHLGSKKTLDTKKEEDVTPKLSLEVLKNSEYTYSGEKIKFVDGVYQLRPLPGGVAEDYYVKLDQNYVVFSDVNGDASEDALVILESRLGGTGVFRNLAVVLNENGKAHDVADVYLGDRVQIKTLEVTGATISVTTIPREDESKLETKQYTLVGSKLVLQK